MASPPVKSAERTLDVLEFIASHSRKATHGDIAAGLGIPPGSLSKLLVGLRKRGYVQVDDSGHHSLGPALFSLVERGRQPLSVAEHALPILQWVTSMTREASSYNAWNGDVMDRVCGVDSTHSLGYRMGMPRSFPVYSSSGGKAVLAALAPHELDAVLETLEIKAATAATVRNVTDLRAQLARCREDGVALARNEHTMGVTAMGAAVLGADARPIGALTIVVPDVRFNESLSALCKKTLLSAASRLQVTLRMQASKEDR